jgi:hypothetical protein
MKWEEGRKREEKIAVYRQQAWRRYNHVKTHWWSLCGLPIHAFLIFKPLLIFFSLY